MPGPVIIKAKIKVLTAEEGGKRRTCIFSGYRPNHVFEVPVNNYLITYIGDMIFDYPEICPGDEKEVIVRFMKDQPIDKYLFAGNKWRIQEGSNLIATGEILELL